MMFKCKFCQYRAQYFHQCNLGHRMDGYCGDFKVERPLLLSIAFVALIVYLVTC